MRLRASEEVAQHFDIGAGTGEKTTVITALAVRDPKHKQPPAIHEPVQADEQRLPHVRRVGRRQVLQDNAEQVIGA